MPSSSGLVFSRLSPEYFEVATAHPCDKEQSCLCLAQEGPQGDLLIKMQELAFDCKTCLRIIQTLKVMVKQPTQVRPRGYRASCLLLNGGAGL